MTIYGFWWGGGGGDAVRLSAVQLPAPALCARHVQGVVPHHPLSLQNS